MAFRAAGGGAVDAKGKLLVLAAVSVGQAGQRALDLLVETVASAVDAGLAEMKMPDAAAATALLVVPQSEHDANWMVDRAAELGAPFMAGMALGSTWKTVSIRVSGTRESIRR